jgi:hypothetical protein
MNIFDFFNYDVVFLSYDEPNADQNFRQLLTIVPEAKRVHGVKGSDSAHKQCAQVATTERVIIVDGDNYVTGDFRNQMISLNSDIDAEQVVFSWPSKNIINGLVYGNGGIKCWSTDAIQNMRTHENSDPEDTKNQVDFCWSMNYVPIDKIFSEIHNDVSKQQAWRAGFREGVKMCLDQGLRPQQITSIARSNLLRLLTWMTVGLDNHNGIWAILGARQGFYLTMCTDWDFTQVRDFDYLNNYYKTQIENLSAAEASELVLDLGNQLGSIAECPAPMDAAQSRMFKTFNINPDRQPSYVISTVAQYDIVMITYDESNMEQNWINLKQRFPRAKRVHGVKGIHQAHKVAANVVTTPMFYVVDGDAEIVPEFDFDFVLPTGHDTAVRVWRCKNPVNDLVYGYGGVKLLPTQLVKNMDMSKPDMTTSISDIFIPVQELSNITRFNVDEFSAWRSGFRECCKLASKIIDRQKDAETDRRIDTWCSVGHDRPFGNFAIDGANAGRIYGHQHCGNVEQLEKINNFEWLKEKFNAHYS